MMTKLIIFISLFCYNALLLIRINTFIDEDKMKLSEPIIFFDEVYTILNNSPIEQVQSFKPRIVKDTIICNQKRRVWLCDSMNSVFSYEYIGFREFPNINERNYFTVFDRKFLIDSLFFGDDIPNDFSIMAPYFTVYNFNFFNKKYMALFSENTRISTTIPNNILILFDMTDEKNIFPILHVSQASTNLACFGDLNNDKKLDFINWAVGYEFIDTVSFYSLIDTKFVKDPNYYAIVENVNNLHEFILNYQKSKWFFNFNGSK